MDQSKTPKESVLGRWHSGLLIWMVGFKNRLTVAIIHFSDQISCAMWRPPWVGGLSFSYIRDMMILKMSQYAELLWLLFPCMFEDGSICNQYFMFKVKMRNQIPPSLERNLLILFWKLSLTWFLILKKKPDFNFRFLWFL